MMRRALLMLPLIVALAFPCHAADSRLAQKISYQSGYKRLHVIAEELSDRTGVAIRTGSNKQDWRVRDIPVIICVKDMPLGRLLDRLALCTHVRLVAEKVAGAQDQKPTYRLYRDKKLGDDIPAKLKAVTDTNRELSMWAWDTLVDYSKMPDASADIPTTKPYETLEIDAQRIRVLGQALAALGPEARAKAITGEQVTVRISSSPAYSPIYDYALKHPSWDLRGTPTGDPTPSERKEALLAIKVSRQDEPGISGGFSLDVYGIPVADGNDRMLDVWEAEPVMCAKALASVKKLKLKQPPDSAALDIDEQFPDQSFKLIKTDDDWKAADLQTKIKLDLPNKKGNDFRYAEVLTALAKSWGVNIVCEDFASRLLAQHRHIQVVPNAETTPAVVLKYFTDMDNVHWFFDSNSKLLIGWAVNWPKKHNALVAESYLQGLRDKREKSGLELDDLVSLYDLTPDQCTDWIRETPDFPGLMCDFSSREWRFYNALCADDKALAKSPEGLPLAKLDPAWLAEMLDDSRDEIGSRSVSFSMPDEHPSDKERKRYLADADMLGKLVLKVWAEPLKSWSTLDVDATGHSCSETYTPGPNGPSKHYYTISLTDPSVKVDKLHWRCWWWEAAFPIYTQEREAELRKKGQAEEAK